MTPTYAAENFGLTYWEAAPLIRAHAVEVGLLEMPLRFEVDVVAYTDLERSGVLKWFTMRPYHSPATPPEARAPLLGYAMWFLTPARVFGGQTVGMNEAIYVRPAQRYYAAGFMAFCEAELRESGAKMLSYTMWEDRQSAKLLERRGFERKQATYWQGTEERKPCA